MPEEYVSPGHPVGRAHFVDYATCNFIGERQSASLVRINEKNPIAAGQVECAIALGGEINKAGYLHSLRHITSDSGRGFVRRCVKENQGFDIGTGSQHFEAFEAGLQVVSLVPGECDYGEERFGIITHDRRASLRTLIDRRVRLRAAVWSNRPVSLPVAAPASEKTCEMAKSQRRSACAVPE